MTDNEKIVERLKAFSLKLDSKLSLSNEMYILHSDNPYEPAFELIMAEIENFNLQFKELDGKMKGAMKDAMRKVTSYEVSKKLFEIGYNSNHAGFHYLRGSLTKFALALEFENANELVAMGFYPAYDLETILEALPKTIEINYIDYRFNLDHDTALYQTDCSDNYEFIFSIKKSDKESLADTAARLLIKLHEKGLITFGENNA